MMVMMKMMVRMIIVSTKIMVGENYVCDEEKIWANTVWHCTGPSHKAG